MGSPLKAINDIKSPTNLLASPAVTPMTVGTQTSSIRNVEVHGTMQTTGASRIDEGTGAVTFPAVRVRIGVNGTTFGLDDKAVQNGVVLALEMDPKSPTWKSEIGTSIATLKGIMDLLLDVGNPDTLNLLLDKFDAIRNPGPSTLDAVGAMYGWIDGNATLIPD